MKSPIHIVGGRSRAQTFYLISINSWTNRSIHVSIYQNEMNVRRRKLDLLDNNLVNLNSEHGRQKKISQRTWVIGKFYLFFSVHFVPIFFFISIHSVHLVSVSSVVLRWVWGRLFMQQEKGMHGHPLSHIATLILLVRKVL